MTAGMTNERQSATAPPTWRRAGRAPRRRRTRSARSARWPTNCTSRSTCCGSGRPSSGQVKPLKRGGGRRYYRPDDIALLRRISDLLYTQGYTIKGVQRLLREGGGTLADDIPPATAAERAEAEAEAARAGTEAASPSCRCPASPAPPRRRARTAARPRGDAEVERLRALLTAHAARRWRSCARCWTEVRVAAGPARC